MTVNIQNIGAALAMNEVTFKRGSGYLFSM